MEKINRPPLSEISTLKKLEENWKQWGIECLKRKRKWRSDTTLYSELRDALESITKIHCTFCDGYPIGADSKKTIEHYFPQVDYPCFTFFWKNLFYCCDKCQSAANSMKPFEYSLKPDNEDYLFDNYFYYDPISAELKVYENLEDNAPNEYAKANLFLKPYGINDNKERKIKRRNTLKNIMNHLKNQKDPDEDRIRDDFPYRYIYDYAEKVYNDRIKKI